jgi:hypothetical protein
MGSASSRWMFKLLKGGKIPQNGDKSELLEGTNVPKFLAEDIKEINDQLRKFPIRERFLIPLKLVYSWVFHKESREDRNDKYNATETEEAIIYNILSIITVTCILGLIYFYCIA